MTDQDTLGIVLEAGERRREQRRAFLRTAGIASIGVSGLTLLSSCGGNGNSITPTPSPSPSPSPSPTVSDVDVLSFALNLEYLEANFYSYAAFGTAIDTGLTGGTGTSGSVRAGAQVPFSDPIVAAYAREVAYDEIAHVKFLRTALGGSAPAQPALNLSGGSDGAFTALAVAAGVIASGATFNPYADDVSFLLGAFVFEDVGVTAYKGGASLLSNKTYLEAAAGILAAEAYHAGLVRTVLYRKGIGTGTPTTPQTETAAILTNAGKISDLRDKVDGTATDDDQGITGTATQSNIVPTDANGIAYSRAVADVHNIVYGTASKVTSGGFFPNGTNIPSNTALQTSNANG